MPRRIVLIGLLLGAAACVGVPDLVQRPERPPDPTHLELTGHFSYPPLQRFPPEFGLHFGGISGIAAVAGGRELLGISDDRSGLRVYRLGLDEQSGFAVSILGQLALDAPAEPAALDPEAIAVLPNSNLLIASDGLGHSEPRIPPALVEYTRHGTFVRALPVRDRFVPNPNGPLTTGVRPNMGFESLTVVPDGSRFYAAAESALVQDGDATVFEPGAPARILEYARTRDSYEPRREFAYVLDPIEKPEFEPGIAVHGLVELLAIGAEDLLALERSYVEEAGSGPDRKGYNLVRVYRVNLRGATDVSGIEPLASVSGISPVSKQLVLDLASVTNLPPELSPHLDNFEGMAFGPRLPDGRGTLILVSDDNFNPTQRTWLLRFAVGATGAGPSGAIE